MPRSACTSCPSRVLWSTIKRATKVALVQNTYEFPGENAPGGGRPMREIAGDVMAYMQANNYEVADAGETITFRGKIAASKSQAFFLSFVTLVCLGSLALVLQIQFPAVGNYWFGLCLLGPYAGVFYWGSAQENEDREFKVKLTANDEETETLMVLRGGKEDVERMEREMALQQQGMVRVKGVFEGRVSPWCLSRRVRGRLAASVLYGRFVREMTDKRGAFERQQRTHGLVRAIMMFRASARADSPRNSTARRRCLDRIHRKP